jgi:hypothetical protein
MGRYMSAVGLLALPWTAPGSGTTVGRGCGQTQLAASAGRLKAAESRSPTARRLGQSRARMSRQTVDNHSWRITSNPSLRSDSHQAPGHPLLHCPSRALLSPGCIPLLSCCLYSFLLCTLLVYNTISPSLLLSAALHGVPLSTFSHVNQQKK